MYYKKIFGEFFREKRLEQNITLREFCLKNGFDPGNISKIERGLLAPPISREKLTKYANALNIKEGSDDWLEFLDRAYACRGEIPSEILSDDEVVKKLPLFFRTMRGEKVTDDKLNEIAEIIRKGN